MNLNIFLTFKKFVNLKKKNIRFLKKLKVFLRVQKTFKGTKIIKGAKSFLRVQLVNNAFKGTKIIIVPKKGGKKKRNILNMFAIQLG